MATFATKFGGFFARGAEAQEFIMASSVAQDAQTRVRPFPNEDIFLFVKNIDNSAVIRQVDPVSERASWRMIMTAAAAAAVLICVLMPKGYGVMAGYELQALRDERVKLIAEEAELKGREAELSSPEVMAQWAKQQAFVDPPSDHIVYLDAPSDGGVVANAR